MKQSHSHIAALDGLRFLAALCVMVAHYAQWLVHAESSKPLIAWLTPLSGFGMALFFTLSGFVIHYNYHSLVGNRRGVRQFVIARFSRLYPLFFMLCAIDIAGSVYLGKHACHVSGADDASWLSVIPFYLTFTHSWFFDIRCGHNLIYQFGMVSAVSWSISVEFFLYLSYLCFGRALAKLSARWLIAVAALFHLAVILYFNLVYHYSATIESFAALHFGAAATDAHGYQDSLIRWLYYFNPFSQMSGFVAGAVAAQLYLSNPKPANRGVGLVYAAMIASMGLHIALYQFIAPQNGFIGRTASTLYMPAIAVMIYAMARFHSSLPARVAGHPLFVRLGEASYSIYLLHALLIFVWSRLYPYFGGYEWLLFLVAVAGVLAASRISYLYFEKPAQRWIRNRWP